MVPFVVVHALLLYINLNPSQISSVLSSQWDDIRSPRGVKEGALAIKFVMEHAFKRFWLLVFFAVWSMGEFFAGSFGRESSQIVAACASPSTLTHFGCFCLFVRNLHLYHTHIYIQ